MSWFKIILKLFAGLLVILFISLGVFYYYANLEANKKSQMIDELSKIPLDSKVDDVITLALKLGFNFELNEFAIPYVLEMKNNDSIKQTNYLPEKVTQKTDLSHFKNGTLNFGLSLFLFERKGCEITFEDGKVKSTRVWWLD